MKRFLPIFVAMCCPLFVFCQDITGLWKGTIQSDTTGQTLNYEIVISKTNGKYTGYSHTWFVINDQPYFGVKKLKVRVAKNGKVVLQDDELIANNYPISPLKDVFQLNILDLSGPENEAILAGYFVTNRTREYLQLTGHVSLKKASKYASSDLMSYLQKNRAEENFATAK